MNPQAQALLDAILAKPKAELSKNDKAVLRARRDYLTKKQTEEYKSILKGKNEEPEVKKDETSNPEEARAIIAGRDLSELNSTELRRVAVRLGVPHKKTNKEELLVAIDTVLGQDATNTPE